MKARILFFALIAGLFILGILQTTLRHIEFDIPWLPGETRHIWNIDAKINFEADGKPVIASLSIPSSQAGYTLLSHSASSPGYGLSFLKMFLS